MSLINSVNRTIEVKIVYYGPGLSGKTTNLRKLKELLATERTGELMVLDTHGDRTLFFDWMPVDLGKVKGFDVKIQLYTVPGQVRYNNTRKQVLKGVDGVVFVADSQRAAAEQNEFSYENLKENLQEVVGKDIEDIPLVIQCNKQDLGDVMAPRELARLLGAEHRNYIKAIASQGEGVLETLRLITRLTLEHLRDFFDPEKHTETGQAEGGSLDGDTLLSEILESGAHQRDEDESRSKAQEDGDAHEKTSGEMGMGPIPVGKKYFSSDDLDARRRDTVKAEAVQTNSKEEAPAASAEEYGKSMDEILARIELMELRLEEMDDQPAPKGLDERLVRLEQRMDVMEGEWSRQIHERMTSLERKLDKLADGLAALVDSIKGE